MTQIEQDILELGTRVAAWLAEVEAYRRAYLLMFRRGGGEGRVYSETVNGVNRQSHE